MKTHLILFVLAGVACSACTKKAAKPIHTDAAVVSVHKDSAKSSFATPIRVDTLDFAAYMDAANPFTLDDAGYTARFIPLETASACLVGRYPHTVLWQDKLIIASNEQPLLVFDSKTGQYLNRIGNIGQGPGEYITNAGIAMFWVDQSNGTVYVASRMLVNSLLKYDIAG